MPRSRSKASARPAPAARLGVLVITTGGTIGALPYPDPLHPPALSAMPPAGQDFVRDALAGPGLRCLSFEPRDSKLIDAAYRDNLLEAVAAAPERWVLITHGTDALLATADFFHQRHPPGKTIVLTGAMTPLSNGAESDGHRNLAFSLELLNEHSPALAPVNVVLSDFDETGAWTPRLYPHEPGRYEKFYAEDGRYNRLRQIG